MYCPLNAKTFYGDCAEDKCAWWCPDDKLCAIRKICIELIKLEEK